jgi:hypothetical protein
MMNFDNRSSLNENSSLIHDNSIYQNNGTIFGNITFNSTGKNGKSLKLNSTNSYVRVQNSPSLNITNGITISFWIDNNSITATSSTGTGSQVGTYIDYCGINPSANMQALFPQGYSWRVNCVPIQILPQILSQDLMEAHQFSPRQSLEPC